MREVGEGKCIIMSAFLRRFLLLPLGWQIYFLRTSSQPHLHPLSSSDATMSSPTHSLLSLDGSASGERRMLHIKTKEECRLGDEVVEVWCVELPSKHAEGILKYDEPVSRKSSH